MPSIKSLQWSDALFDEITGNSIMVHVVTEGYDVDSRCLSGAVYLRHDPTFGPGLIVQLYSLVLRWVIKVIF